MASPFWSTNPTPGNLESTCTMIPLQVLDSICDSNGSFIHTPNEVHSTNISMCAFNSYGSKISTHDSLHAKFHYHIFKTAGNMKHAKQLGNQYPSWTSTRHILVFFTYITLSNGYSVRINVFLEITQDKPTYNTYNDMMETGTLCGFGTFCGKILALYQC